MPMPAEPADRSPLEAAVAVVKPRLRGWIHAGTFPLALAAGIVLVALAPTTKARMGAAVFALTAALLFGTSAVYHRGTWSPRLEGVLKRLDHSNIFLIIAGTYTPFALLLLPEGQSRSLLLIAWAGALGGVLFRVFWVGAPRWLYTPIYVALGWVAVFYLEPAATAAAARRWSRSSRSAACSTPSARVVYGTKRPNPSPRWFGFHEIFHAFTVAAFAVHYIAVSMAVYGHTTRSDPTTARLAESGSAAADHHVRGVRPQDHRVCGLWVSQAPGSTGPVPPGPERSSPGPASGGRRRCCPRAGPRCARRPASPAPRPARPWPLPPAPRGRSSGASACSCCA